MSKVGKTNDVDLTVGEIICLLLVVIFCLGIYVGNNANKPKDVTSIKVIPLHLLLSK